MHQRLFASLALVGASLILGTIQAGAADLPQATQKALAGLKLDASLLDGLDAELAVPKPWLDGAAKEKEVVILGTWEAGQFRAMTAPFKERYPFVTLRYVRAGTTARTIQILAALGEGRVTADVLTSLSDATSKFDEMKALADLSELPGFANLPSDFVAAGGSWISHKLSFRCMAYNTEKVKKADLPQKWDDLLDNPRWRGGNLAVSNYPSAWLLTLWDKFGAQWGNDFIRRLFTEVQPQRRQEGMTATTALAAAGEFLATIPAPEWVAERYVMKGAPIDYHCPSPVPITVSQIAMLEKSPHKDGARLFINWLISREGQVLQYTETSALPAHKALQSSRFLPFGDTIVGKPRLVRDDALLQGETAKQMQAAWNFYWTAASGAQKSP
jgi:iron(III) transport system substrate-binding protein